MKAPGLDIEYYPLDLIKFLNDHPSVERKQRTILNKYFDKSKDSFISWVNHKNMLYCFVSHFSTIENRLYGKHQHITKSQLRKRRFFVTEILPNTVNILFLDEKYDPKNYKLVRY
jgi:hypothetical protein